MQLTNKIGCIPVNELRLFVSLYNKEYKTSTSENYIKRIIQELICTGNLERKKIGYMSETSFAKCYESEKNRKYNNIITITDLGIETLNEKRNSPFYGLNLRASEVKLRKIKSEIFFESVSTNIEINYTDAREVKKKYHTTKSVQGTQAIGYLTVRNLERKNEGIVIYSTGSSISSCSEGTEKNFIDNIKSKAEEGVSEAIILCENAKVMLESFTTSKKRAESKNENTKEGIEKKARPLLIDMPISKNFVVMNEGGVEQMRIYTIPQEIRREYYLKKAKEKEELKKYFSEEGIKSSKGFVFDCQTKDEIIYIGVEQNIDEIKTLLNYVKYSNKELIILCLKGQEKNYEEIFKDLEYENRLYIKSI